MNGSNPYGNGGFAPPPGRHHFYTDSNFRSSTPISSGYYHFSDSSGFCSSESAVQYGHHDNHSALFERARAMSRHNTIGRSHQSHFNNNTNSSYCGNVFGFATLPRKASVNGCGGQSVMATYKGSDGIPFVAKMNMNVRDLTFREFRKQFGISSNSTKRFMFKSECEDGSAAFQWTIICDDDEPLPVFEGRITAECRKLSESD
uniref:DIX domain-containing protein n=1 Tax=Steinernema glaseri TaxID=37863 RepID=A0A1I7ZXA5_9BILA